MSDLKVGDLDLEQQAKLDKELAWCIRKLYTKLEHAKKDDKKVNEIIMCINILKNPSELIIKKRQVMFKMHGDYRSKMKAEESKKSSSKDELEIKVKFMNDGSKEIKNSKYLKKSKAHDPECVDKKFHTLSLNEKSAKEIGENYFQMEAMKNSHFKFNFQVE
ncbi:hypothetical protein BpHYR1_049911 [Brachionus plicatilis]|uniref:Uncharacterized protein n=1 Tax=Brachionus plicatilis TaxID=10195 RepID=A0A3M7SIX5_BRAPC|nr:hypothetical protein BpHYR1_049911 [Brachionus plicatilis]